MNTYGNSQTSIIRTYISIIRGFWGQILERPNYMKYGNRWLRRMCKC